MHVVAVGRGNFEIPFMNGGRLLSGGFVRARYAGWRHGASVQRSIGSSRAVSHSRAFDGGGLASDLCRDGLEAPQGG
jgi:hypothetical protein